MISLISMMLSNTRKMKAGKVVRESMAGKMCALNAKMRRLDWNDIRTDKIGW